MTPGAAWIPERRCMEQSCLPHEQGKDLFVMNHEMVGLSVTAAQPRKSGHTILRGENNVVLEGLESSSMCGA